MTREARLAEALVQAADILVEDFDVIDFLHTLAAHCVDLLDVAAAGVMLADNEGNLHAAASSAGQARLLELFELEIESGPCIDCYNSGEQVVNVDLLSNGERWPRFAGAAEMVGYVSAHALPMRLRETVIGALNLFCTETRPLSPQDVRAGQALADVATIGILGQRSIVSAELLSAQLQTALNSRIVIEQAKGVLAERCAISVQEAFELMRGQARSLGRRLSDFAGDVATGQVALAEQSPAPAPAPAPASAPDTTE
jgi:transcriptional regulator with GAF, ATPase, and Fis domain